MSTVEHVTEHAGFWKKVLGKLSAYGHARSLFSRTTRSKWVPSSLYSGLAYCTGCTMTNILRLFALVPGPVGRDAEPISDRRDRSHEEGITNPEVQSMLNDAEFGRVDPTGWFPHYKNCVQHFVDYSQHTTPSAVYCRVHQYSTTLSATFRV
jgi:hypothetical protein